MLTFVPNIMRSRPTTSVVAVPRARTGTRAASTSAVMSFHASARSKPSGRTTGAPVGSADVTRSTRNVRSPAAVSATRYQARSFVARPSGWTHARRRRAITRDVAERELRAVDDRVLDGLQLRGRGAGVVRSAPIGRVHDDCGGCRLGVGSERFGEGAHQLAQRGLDLGRRGRRRARDEEQGTGFGRRQAAEIRAGAADELPAAVAARLRVHGHAGHAEGFEVSPRGALRHLELGCDLGRGDLPARLQVHEDGHEPVGAHVRILARNPDSL